VELSPPRGGFHVTPGGDTHRIQCAEVWGGIRDEFRDVCTGSITASLFSASSDGGKGGDIYYLSVCDKDELTRVALVDVAGHGTVASEASEWLYEILARRMNDLDSHEVLGELNAKLAARGYSAMATAVVAGFLKEGERLLLSYAGHHPVYVRPRDGESWRVAGLEAQRLPLGVVETTTYAQACVPLSSGDRVFLYTDGVPETPDSEGDLFGAERLLSVLDAHTGDGLSDLRSAVIDSLQTHSGGSLSHDDVTVMVVEVN
jgi:sigma-B regulation protein RsbU (phosphoserine phosphatase)